jgi:hypothetical protein
VDAQRDRVIVVAVRDRPQRDAPCRFRWRDTAMLCEAASGTQGVAARARLKFDTAAVEALHALVYVQEDPR